MAEVLLVIIACIIIGYGLFGTEVGKRILLRIKGTAKEAIDKDASTQAGAAAHYQNAIDKKEEEYRNALKEKVVLNEKISEKGENRISHLLFQSSNHCIPFFRMV